MSTICGVCSVAFDCPTMDAHLKSSGRWFACPNGHWLSWKRGEKGIDDAPAALVSPRDRIEARVKVYRDTLRKIALIEAGTMGGLARARELAEEVLKNED